MGLKKRGRYRYGDGQPDIRSELLRYSRRNAYPIQHFAAVVCKCGGRLFVLRMDAAAGAAVRRCRACGPEHPLGDSADYLDEAELQKYECVCGDDVFEITVGVSLYEGGEDVRWLYLGCRCPACGLTGCYDDWKKEFNGFKELLRNV